jgi:hypothetical protein
MTRFIHFCLPRSTIMQVFESPRLDTIASLFVFHDATPGLLTYRWVDYSEFNPRHWQFPARAKFSRLCGLSTAPLLASVSVIRDSTESHARAHYGLLRFLSLLITEATAISDQEDPAFGAVPDHPCCWRLSQNQLTRCFTRNSRRPKELHPCSDCSSREACTSSDLMFQLPG